jgi:hypothetical protein
MAKPSVHYVLTPSQAAEKALIVEQMRTNPRGPWVNGKKLNAVQLKHAATVNKKTR